MADGYHDFGMGERQRRTKNDDQQQQQQIMTYKYGEDFHSPGGALTLSPHEVCEDKEDQTSDSFESEQEFQRTHDSGWTIKGRICHDYASWVNDFEANHPQLGRVWGNFENEVYATSDQAFRHFFEHHQPEAWDYQDI